MGTSKPVVSSQAAGDFSSLIKELKIDADRATIVCETSKAAEYILRQYENLRTASEAHGEQLPYTSSQSCTQITVTGNMHDLLNFLSAYNFITPETLSKLQETLSSPVSSAGSSPSSGVS